MRPTIRVIIYTVARLRRFGIQALIIPALLFFFTAPLTRAEESHPGLAAEAMYAEALIAYNKKKIDETIKILDEVLRLDPDHLSALEMRALTLKIKGDDPKSVQIYKKLLLLKPEADRGPYYFELGTLYSRNKKNDLAKAMFLKCLSLKFNRVPVSFYLGTMEFGDGNLKNAERYLTFVVAEAPAELKTVAYYYLGLVNFKNGLGALGVSDILEARTLAKKNPNSKLATDIGTAADKVLEPFSHPQWFLNASMMTQYDSNIGQLPLGIVDPSAVSGKATPKTSFSAGAGRMTAPLGTLQLVASYRGSYNKNFNSQTKSFEFFANTGSVYVNYRPLSKTSGGLKFESNYIFQHQQVDSTIPTSPYTFRAANFTMAVGPFIKFYATQELQMQIDLGYRKLKAFASPTTSGHAVDARLSASSAGASSRFWNPGGNINIEKNDTFGADTKYLAYGGGLANAMRVTEKDTATFSVDLLRSTYPQAAIARSDTNIPIRLNWSRRLTPKWTVLLDFSYTSNRSLVPTSFSYNRFLAGLGAAWSL